MLRTTVLVALLFPGVALPTTLATIDHCTRTVDEITIPVARLLEVSGPLAYMDGSCHGRGVVGGGAFGFVPACVDEGVHAVGSVYCGPVIEGHAWAACTFMAFSRAVDAITVGFDLDGDGHIFYHNDADHAWLLPGTLSIGIGVGSGEGPALPDLTKGSYQVVNPASEPGRLIAYATSRDNVQVMGSALVGCLPI